ncbi:hypothetical protein ACFVZD_27390 [Streptomyces sp. NPDC058287]|uniref:hypothetical protein n=1 Tax=unclassified Streptomyces TaxID=2593676 RepID=UPI0036F18F83
MTEISTQPVAQPAAATLENTPESAPAAPVSPEEVQVEHTEGGWPVVPLAVSGANTTAALIASASLVGGPVAAAVAFTGAVVLGAVATRRSAPDTDAKTGDKAKAAQPGGKSQTATGKGGRTGGRRLPGQASRSGGRRSGAAGRAGRKAGGAGLRSRTASHGARTGAGSGGISLAKRGAGAARKPKNPHAGKTAGASKAGRAGGASGRVGQVKALRGAKKQQAPTRSKQRAQTSAARRSVADARRQAKQAARAAKARAGQRGPLARAKSWGGRKAASGVKALVNKARTARDHSAERKVAAGRSNVRKAPARKKARRALWRSAARFQGRRLLAALLGGAVGLLGCLSTPLGRKLRWSWLMYPGRRLYGRLVAHAREEREERDEDTRDVLAEEEAAADQAATEGESSEQLDGQVDRPAELVPTSSAPTSSVSDVSGGENVSGFRFEEAAAEMEQAALSYDPDNAMEILAMVEGLPDALTSVAKVMKTLSERSDSEFPLEKEVAQSFSDIFGALMSAVAVAEDMGPLFRNVHSQDIARHEDPRNGPEAEKGWNV